MLVHEVAEDAQIQGLHTTLQGCHTLSEINQPAAAAQTASSASQMQMQTMAGQAISCFETRCKYGRLKLCMQLYAQL